MIFRKDEERPMRPPADDVRTTLPYIENHQSAQHPRTAASEYDASDSQGSLVQADTIPPNATVRVSGPWNALPSTGMIWNTP